MYLRDGKYVTSARDPSIGQPRMASHTGVPALSKEELCARLSGYAKAWRRISLWLMRVSTGLTLTRDDLLRCGFSAQAIEALERVGLLSPVSAVGSGSRLYPSGQVVAALVLLPVLVTLPLEVPPKGNGKRFTYKTAVEGALAVLHRLAQGPSDAVPRKRGQRP